MSNVRSEVFCRSGLAGSQQSCADAEATIALAQWNGVKLAAALVVTFGAYTLAIRASAGWLLWAVGVIVLGTCFFIIGRMGTRALHSSSAPKGLVERFKAWPVEALFGVVMAVTVGALVAGKSDPNWSLAWAVVGGLAAGAIGVGVVRAALLRRWWEATEG